MTSLTLDTAGRYCSCASETRSPCCSPAPHDSSTSTLSRAETRARLCTPRKRYAMFLPPLWTSYLRIKTLLKLSERIQVLVITNTKYIHLPYIITSQKVWLGPISSNSYYKNGILFSNRNNIEYGVFLCISTKCTHIYYIYIHNIRVYLKISHQEDVCTEYAHWGFFPKIYFSLCVHVCLHACAYICRCS